MQLVTIRASSAVFRSGRYIDWLGGEESIWLSPIVTKRQSLYLAAVCCWA